MPGFSFQDYELSSALLKLTLIRNAKDNLGESRTSCLSQMSYLLSFPSNNPKLSDLICPYRSCDLNHLIESSITDHSFSLFPTTGINDFTAKYNDYSVPIKFLPENQTFDCIYEQSDEFFSRVVIDGNSNSQKKENSGQFIIENKIPYFISEKLGKKRLSNLKKVFAPNILFSATMENQILKKDTVISDAILSLKGTIQNKDILAKANLQDIQVISSNSPILPPTSYSQENNYFVFLPKSFQKSGVLIGDKGHLSYAGRTSTSTQEQRISIYVGGFYDPGFLPTASRFLLVPFAITKLINSSTSTISPDNSPTNGINIWFDDYHQADVIKAKLEKALTKSDIAPFWKVTTYKEYEFSKDLLEQFQSDRTLFTLIGVIILIVACSNIISLLILLVNDKKKEIAVIQAMGGSKKSIVLIFGLCGVIMGFFSCLIGSLAAIFTLQHLDVIVTILSTIQGHAAFNPAFFGQNLPNHLSSEAMLFIFITTPILSLIAGIIPAIKASKLQPSQILRSQ
jgi:lipoprotein-releasing system permease protein